MSKPKKPPIEKRLAARYGRIIEDLPLARRRAICTVLIMNGGLVSVVSGLACAVAGALFLMGMARGITTDQTHTVTMTGVICVVLGGLSWAGWLANRVGRLLKR